MKLVRAGSKEKIINSIVENVGYELNEQALLELPKKDLMELSKKVEDVLTIYENKIDKVLSAFYPEN